MKTFLFALLISVGLMAGSTGFASQGNNNGIPFQELQAAVDAALAAEAAAREAADAAAASALAAEEAARIDADAVLQGEIEANAWFAAGLNDRVSVLEGLHFGRSVSWTETEDFELISVANAIVELNYQPGEWFAWIFRSAYYNFEYGFCSNHPRIADWLNAAVTGTYFFYNIYGPDTYIHSNGYWYNNMPHVIGTQTYYAGYPYLISYANTPQMGLYQRAPDQSASHEILINGFWLGNTATINIGGSREIACGF